MLQLSFCCLNLSCNKLLLYATKYSLMLLLFFLFQYAPHDWQAALCVPEEDGMTVHCPTQWVDLTQAAVAQTLNYPVQR